MKRRLKLKIALVFLMFLAGCSILPEMVAPVANFAIGLYNADDYYSKECLWYDEVRLNDDTKKWFKDNNPPEVVIKDLAAVARNNDMFKEVCPSDENHNNADH
jgi:hypothetical protein